MDAVADGRRPDFGFHHLGVAVASIDGALPVYRTVFGYDVLAGPFEDAIQRVTVCFVGPGSGGPTIELVEPAGAESPIARHLAKGIGAYHVCYEVGALEPALAYVRAAGCVVIAHPVPATAFGGRRIAWLYLPTRQLVELLERT